MTHRFTLPGAKRLDDAERLFAEFDELGAAWKSPPISPSQLYSYAERPDPAADPELARLLATDARLGRDFALGRGVALRRAVAGTVLCHWGSSPRRAIKARKPG